MNVGATTDANRTDFESIYIKRAVRIKRERNRSIVGDQDLRPELRCLGCRNPR